MVHGINFSTGGEAGGWIPEFMDRLFYQDISRRARAIHRNIVLKKRKK